VKGNKIFVTKVTVINEHFVIRKANRTVAQGFVESLHFLRRIMAIGDVGMAVKIGFVKTAFFGDQFQHNRTSFTDFL
jgi:hypothetical protein